MLLLREGYLIGNFYWNVYVGRGDEISCKEGDIKM